MVFSQFGWFGHRVVCAPVTGKEIVWCAEFQCTLKCGCRHYLHVSIDGTTSQHLHTNLHQVAALVELRISFLCFLCINPSHLNMHLTGLRLLIVIGKDSSSETHMDWGAQTILVGLTSNK